MNEKLGLKQYLVPYLMSSHPGSTMKEAVELAEYCRDLGYMPEQVQDFYPTPSTISTCMYYTGLDPRTMKPVYVPHNPHEKEMQARIDSVPESKEPGTGKGSVEKSRKRRSDRIWSQMSATAGRKSTGTEWRETGPPKKKTIRNTHRKKNS